MEQTHQALGTAPLNLHPARRQTLVERVAEQLIKEIERQQLPAGSRLPSEREFMNRLQVGRSTLREALNGLALLGLIEIHHGKGIFVADAPANARGHSEIAEALARSLTRELLEAREPVEVAIVQLAAERRTASDLTELQETLDNHERMVNEKRSTAKYSALFHHQLADAAHNQVLASFINSIQKQLVERGYKLETLPGYREWELAEHREIFATIRAGDSVSAASRIREHLRSMLEHHDRLLPEPKK